jgi:hypothetical protein
MALYSKLGRQQVFDLINAANPSAVPYSDSNSTIEAITAGNFTVDGQSYNTSVRLRGLQHSGYTGSKTLYYNRLNISSLFLNATFRLDSFGAKSVYEALPVLNARYGLNLTQGDVNDATLASPGVANYTGTVVVSGKVGSPFLTNQGVTLVYARGLPKLDAFVLSKNLTAYKHPTADGTATKLSAQMLTIGLDFTEVKNMLLVDGTGMPNFSALSQVLTTQYGLPQWSAPLNSNYVTDNPTSAVGNANKAFDRVVVQTGIDNGVVTGVAYYHYMS